MTDLFHLSLRGEGTTEIESLGSYLHRLSVIHSVSVCRLLEHCDTRYSCKHPGCPTNITPFRQFGTLNVFIRPNKTTSKIVKILSDATGLKDIDRSTFLSLKGVLARSMQAFNDAPNWCPCCMLEFSKSNKPAYFKLIWQLRDVTHCPIHRVKLLENCTYCGAHQGNMEIKRDCALCQNCERPLAIETDLLEKENSWSLPGADLIELLDHIAQRPKFNINHEKLKRQLVQLIEKEKPRLQNLPSMDHLKMLSYAARSESVTLNMARRIAYILDINLTDLLTGQANLTSNALDLEWSKQLPKDLALRKQANTLDHKKTYAELQRYLSEQSKKEPLSLRAVAQEIGVTDGYLQHRFPKLAKKIVKRRADYRKAQRALMTNQSRIEARKYFHEKNKAAETITLKGTLRVLRRKTGFSINLLRKVIKEEYISHINIEKKQGILL